MATKGEGSQEHFWPAGQGEEGLPTDKEGPIEAMALGKGIQPTPGDLARKKQGE